MGSDGGGADTGPRQRRLLRSFVRSIAHYGGGGNLAIVSCPARSEPFAANDDQTGGEGENRVMRNGVYLRILPLYLELYPSYGMGYRSRNSYTIPNERSILIDWTGPAFPPSLSGC